MAGLGLFSRIFICAMMGKFKKGIRYETGVTNLPQKRPDYL